MEFASDGGRFRRYVKTRGHACLKIYSSVLVQPTQSKVYYPVHLVVNVARSIVFYYAEYDPAGQEYYLSNFIQMNFNANIFIAFVVVVSISD